MLIVCAQLSRLPSGQTRAFWRSDELAESNAKLVLTMLHRWASTLLANEYQVSEERDAAGLDETNADVYALAAQYAKAQRAIASEWVMPEPRIMREWRARQEKKKTEELSAHSEL